MKLVKFDREELNWLRAADNKKHVISLCCRQIDKDLRLSGLPTPNWMESDDLEDVLDVLEKFIDRSKNTNPNWYNLKYHMDMGESYEEFDQAPFSMAQMICYHALRKVWLRAVHAENH